MSEIKHKRLVVGCVIAIFIICLALGGIFVIDQLIAPGSQTIHLTSSNNDFQHISGDLYYDPNTYVVYRGAKTMNGYEVPVPYYASNGLPYLFDRASGTLEVIVSE